MDLALNRSNHYRISNNTHYSVDEAIEAHDLIKESVEDLPSFEELGERIVNHISNIAAAYKKIQPAHKLIELQKELGL